MVLANQWQSQYGGIETQLVGMGVELNLAAQPALDFANVARSMMNETRAEGHDALPDAMTTQPQENKGEELDLVSILVPRHTCVGYADTAPRAAPQSLCRYRSHRR